MFCYGVCLCVQHVGLCNVVVVFADILKAARRAVIAVADNHFVLNHQGSYLAALAVAVFCPDACHAQVSQVKQTLFFFFVHCVYM